MLRHLHHVDHVCQVVLRVTESQRAPQLLWLTAVGLYLRLDALFVELSQTLVHHLLVAHIVRIGDHLHVASSSVVVALITFLDALWTGENPVEECREPSLQGLRVLLRESIGTFQQLHAIEHLHKRIGIDDPIAATFAVVETGNNLCVVQVRIHARVLIEEPHAQQLRSLLGIALVATEVPGQRERRHTGSHLLQLWAVELFQLGIRHSVATDVGQPVGLRGVGPEVAAQTQVVVLVATGGSLLLHHHRQRSLLHAGIGLLEQLSVGSGIGAVAKMLPHSCQVRLVPNGLCACRHDDQKKQGYYHKRSFHVWFGV